MRPSRALAERTARMDATVYPRTSAAAGDAPVYERLARRLAAPLVVILFSLEILLFGVLGRIMLLSPQPADSNSSFWGFRLFTLCLCALFLGASMDFAHSQFWPKKWPLWQRDYSTWLNDSIAGRLGHRRLTTTRQHAAIAAELLSLRTSAVQLEVSGTDSVAQIIATRIATLRKDIETALATLEGIDGQTETAFGLRFLNEMGLKDKDLWRTRSNLAAVLTSYKAAVQFDTPEGCEAALGLVSKQLTD